MKKNIHGIIIYLNILTLVFTFIFSYPISSNAETLPKNIIILNSYHAGMTWTDDQVKGITKTLENSKLKYNLYIEYMDARRYPLEENYRIILENCRNKYSNLKIDLIIVTDDEAFQFALKHRRELFSDAGIVFSGLNNQDTIEDRVTGVYEKIDPENTMKLALAINPKIKNVYLLYGPALSGQLIGKQSSEKIKNIAPNVNIISPNPNNIDRILADVKNLGNDSIIFIAVYYLNDRTRVSGFREFFMLVRENSKVPIYTLYDYGIGNGAIGGSTVCGEAQGEIAGQKAIEALNGKKIGEIPIEVTKNKYIFDYNEMKRFKVDIKKIPSESLIINEPFSFIKTYKNVVITTTLILSILIIFILILSYYLRRLRRMKESLENKNSELSILYSELRETDNRLREQFNKLNATAKALEESEYNYSVLFNGMMNYFIIFEPIFSNEHKLIDLKFVRANPSYLKEKKLKLQGIEGKTWTEVFGYPNKDLAIYQSAFLSGMEDSFETYYANEEVYYRVNAFRINDKHLGIVADNITEYKAAIKEIKKLNEGLEFNIIERTRELQGAVEDLEAFTYTVSHDLKAPLRLIERCSCIILEEHEKELNNEIKELLININKTSQDMAKMISRLLEYATISSGDIHKEKMNVEDTFNMIFNEMLRVIYTRDIKLIIETRLPDINVDKIMFTQVIYNALSNAVKFTKNQSIAYIHVGCTITSVEYIFYIKDNGIGFNMENVSKLFKLFQRLNSEEEYEGVGLGLVIIKRIIERHGGRVWIEGKQNEGATLHFAIPYER